MCGIVYFTLLLLLKKVVYTGKHNLLIYAQNIFRRIYKKLIIWKRNWVAREQYWEGDSLPIVLK